MQCVVPSRHVVSRPRVTGSNVGRVMRRTLVTR
jgi:hypothetical protein